MIVLLVIIIISSSLAMIHAVEVASHSHSSTSTSTTVTEMRLLIILTKDIILVRTFLQFLLFEFHSSYFTIDTFDGVLQLLLHLLRLLQLLLYDQAMVCLQDLLVDEMAPSPRIELIVEVEFVPISLLVP